MIKQIILAYHILKNENFNLAFEYFQKSAEK